MKRLFLSLILLAAIVSLLICSGCTKAYMPTQHNVPLFLEKGETEITATATQTTTDMYLTSSARVQATQFMQLQAAYALTNNISLVGGGAKAFGANSGFFTEAGAGLFRAGKNDDTRIMGVTGVIGYGSAFPSTNYDYFYDPATDTQFRTEIRPSFFRGYLQPYIGYRKENTEFAFSSRLTALHYGIPVNDHPNYRSGNFLFAEPAVTFRFGMKNLKFHTQVATAIKLGGAPFNYSSLSLNAGASLRLPLK